MTQLIVGLGNPGGEYAKTRHNVGWMCLDELEKRGRSWKKFPARNSKATEGSIDGYEVVLVRPTTFMNLSGSASSEMSDMLGVSPHDTIVVHDDIDLPFGKLQVRRGGGSAGHNGIKSLVLRWGTPDFIRVRIGVGRPSDGKDAADHVLDSFAKDEREELPAILGRAADAVIEAMKNGVESAANLYNKEPNV